MKDKVKITYAEDGHKIVTHTKAIGKRKYHQLMRKAGIKKVSNNKRRYTNYWERHRKTLNLPIYLYLVINIIMLTLAIGSAITLIKLSL